LLSTYPLTLSPVKAEQFIPLTLQLLTCPVADLDRYSKNVITSRGEINSVIQVFRDRKILDESGLLDRAISDFLVIMHGRMMQLLKERTSIKSRFLKGPLKTKVTQFSNILSSMKKNVSCEKYSALEEDMKSLCIEAINKINFVISSVSIPTRADNMNKHPFFPRNLRFDIYEQGRIAEKPIITQLLNMCFLGGVKNTDLQNFDIPDAKKEELASDRLNFSLDNLIENPKDSTVVLCSPIL